MVNVVTFHSAHAGTGKSTIAANVATLLANEGQRVGIIDADLKSLGMHPLFEVPTVQINHTFNDYLLGMCSGTDAVLDVTPYLHLHEGRVFLVPASANPEDLERVLHEGYSIELITDSLRELADQLHLDTLLIDTHSGLTEQTLLSLLSIAISDILAIVLRLDQRDYQGTGVTVDVARTLEVPRIALVINQVLLAYEFAAVEKQVSDAYQCEVAAVLPYSEEITALGMGGMFVLRYPEHPATHMFKHLALSLSHSPQ